MSCGLRGPSINGSPALTRSISRTKTCTPRGSKYSFASHLSGTKTILRCPLRISPYLTSPSISVMTAVSCGLRASYRHLALGAVHHSVPLATPFVNDHHLAAKH